jgi:ribosome-binding ATPase YchF (GTP1/OBG family)
VARDQFLRQRIHHEAQTFKRRGAQDRRFAGFVKEGGYERADLWPGVPDALRRGLLRDEGKEYLVQDGDVCIFKTSA